MKAAKLVLLISVVWSVDIVASPNEFPDDYYLSDEYIASLKDPRNRDEDLSKTVVTGRYVYRADGLYEYHYHVDSPAENKGIILTFQLDISCENPIRKPEGLIIVPSMSDDGKFISIGAIDQNYNPRIGPRVSTDNMAHWFAGGIEPGESKIYALVSAEKPAYREYKLHPSVSTFGWDYTGTYIDEKLPWIEDWIATGTTIGPRCSTDESPIPDNPPGTGDNGGQDDTGNPGSGDDSDSGNCHPGQGHAYGHDKGKGHDSSQGQHKGHSHDC